MATRHAIDARIAGPQNNNHEETKTNGNSYRESDIYFLEAQAVLAKIGTIGNLLEREKTVVKTIEMMLKAVDEGACYPSKVFYTTLQSCVEEYVDGIKDRQRLGTMTYRASGEFLKQGKYKSGNWHHHVFVIDDSSVSFFHDKKNWEHVAKGEKPKKKTVEFSSITSIEKCSSVSLCGVIPPGERHHPHHSHHSEEREYCAHVKYKNSVGEEKILSIVGSDREALGNWYSTLQTALHQYRVHKRAKTWLRDHAQLLEDDSDASEDEYVFEEEETEEDRARAAALKEARRASETPHSPDHEKRLSLRQLRKSVSLSSNFLKELPEKLKHHSAKDTNSNTSRTSSPRISKHSSHSGRASEAGSSDDEESSTLYSYKFNDNLVKNLTEQQTSRVLNSLLSDHEFGTQENLKHLVLALVETKLKWKDRRDFLLHLCDVEHHPQFEQLQAGPRVQHIILDMKQHRSKEPSSSSSLSSNHS